MVNTTKAELAAQVKRLQRALDRSKAKCDGLGRSLAEALEREKATTEILELIGRSPARIQPVFDGIANTTLRLIGGVSAAVTRLSDGMLHLAAFTSTSKTGDDTLRRQFPCPLANLPGQARAIRSKAPYWIGDTEKSATNREVARARGYRSAIFVPLLWNKEPIGAISVSRRQPGAFSDHQIGVLKTFADQAVIAIENARLFDEATEALEQQTAISEILKVMSASPTNVRPVLDTVAERAARICEANDVRILLIDNGALRYSAGIGELPEQALGETRPIDRRLVSGRAVVDRVPVQVEDLSTPEARKEFPLGSEMHDRYGHRTVVAVPLVRDDRALGVIMLRRLEVQRFSEKQIELLKTFADQAAIAIENVRLFNETREALERQTATAEVLRVISSSPGNLEPVYRTILEGIGRLCEANIEALFLYEDGTLGAVATNGTTQEFAAHLARSRFGPSRETTTRLAALERRVVHVPDLLADRSFAPKPRDLYERENVRTVLSVPMLREGALVGVITAWRREVRPFSERQVDLVGTFADQAVIAIENVRLFKELQARNADLSDALEQQTATSEILKAISGSPTDLQPVFEIILQNAVRICAAEFGTIFRFDGQRFHRAAGVGTPAALVEYQEQRGPFAPESASSSFHEMMRTKRACHILDAASRDVQSVAAKYGGARSVVHVPLLKEDELVGSIVIYRQEVLPFTEKQIELVQNFAAQAVIAIENVRLFKELQARNAELSESLEQQTATARILQVISSSPTDLQPVFDTILDNARRLCEADRGALHLFDGEVFTLVSDQGSTAAFAEYRERARLNRAGALSALGQLGEKKCVMHIADLSAWSGYASRDPMTVASVELEGTRTYLGIPMLKDGKLLGAITFRRQEVRPFSEKQIALLQTFAAQAVIAIENARLFKELEARNTELTASLEQQTATSEILRVISRSPTDTDPVFTSIVQSGARLFEGANVSLRLVKGEQIEFVTSSDRRDRTLFRLGDDRQPSARAIRRKEVIVVNDMLTEDWVTEEARERARRRGFRGLIAAPLMKGGDAIGTLAVNRPAPGPFTEQQIELLKTFADQAVIAIENVRLFKELQSRNTELGETLEYQTATSEVLRIISSSPTDAQPVFDAIVRSGVRLFDGMVVSLHLARGDHTELVASTLPVQGLRAEGVALADERSPAARSILKGEIVQVADVLAADVPDQLRQRAQRGGLRSLLSAPLLREGKGIGALQVLSPNPGQFTEKQVALLKTFANQAVIAIENARLFKELEARTEALSRSVNQLTALGDVGQAISSTLDLETVLQTIVSRALQLTGLDSGSIYEFDQQAQIFRIQAAENLQAEIVEHVRKSPIRIGDGIVGRTGVSRDLSQVPDLLDDSYQSGRRELMLRAGYRALLAVPLMREEALLGVLVVSRKTPGVFAPEIVDLLKTFATQSALALQNARLFREIAEKSRQLEVASQHKSQFLASMSHELRTPLNAMLGFNEMLLGEIYGPVPEDMRDPLTDIQSSGKHLLRLINNVLDLAKIEAGRMELSLSDYSVRDTVESVRSTLHPLAAEKGLQLTVDVPEDIPFAYGDFGRITQCLMNLAGNALKFTRAGSVRIAVALQGDLLVYRVTDTGIGIAPDKIDSLFTEFKQTDATIASEFGGTGLGLSITRKFVEMHGGRIWVESELGEGSEFIFEIPLRVDERETT